MARKETKNQKISKSRGKGLEDFYFEASGELKT